MSTAIIGAGFLGGEIARQLLESGADVLVTHNQNPKFPGSLKFDFFADDSEELFSGREIDTVFLSAKIEFVEDQELLEKAMRQFIAGCAGKRLVYFSSDGIFAGEQGNYSEKDLPVPVTNYGKNLALCEKLIREESEDYCIIRPSYLYGFSGGRLDSRLSKASEALKNGERLERFSDMYKSPLGVFQVAQASIGLAFSDYQGIVHVAGPRMSVYEFHKQALEALGVSTDNLVDVKMPVERPADFLADTSLEYSLMKKLTGIEPASIRGSLEKQS
ncbi:MAG: sugar nucleotide-binding protein [Parcubacteria group bacterium]|jgi:dTDP-4-dehydrorhamnose reductase